jgi:hypothetical protein
MNTMIIKLARALSRQQWKDGVQHFISSVEGSMLRRSRSASETIPLGFRLFPRNAYLDAFHALPRPLGENSKERPSRSDPAPA